MDNPIEKKPNEQVPEKTQVQEMPVQKSPCGDISVDVAALAMMPDALFEAGVRLAVDELHEQSQAHPLEALGGLLGLMQGLNAELIKAYAPPVITNAQNAATEALANQMPVVVTKEQGRAIATMLRIQESMVKLAAAHVKVSDEQVRRTRLM